MVEAYITNIPCWIEIENCTWTGRYMKERPIVQYRGSITEIYYDTSQIPYKFEIEYNGVKRTIVPRFDDGIMESRVKGNKIIRVLPDWDADFPKT